MTRARWYLAPIADTAAEIQRFADDIEGVAGEFSSFEQQHGFRIDGVDLGTCALPEGWRKRLVRVQNTNAAALSGHPQFTGWCVEPEDLCVAKLCAFCEKDQNFVAALLNARLVEVNTIAARLPTVEKRHLESAKRAFSWIGQWL
ncbi:DUF6036 family nucleotidyltransferase [Mycobacteroides abscessus]|uniref:DUF6036 family nucleotidyltransferase n=1 Tax=Mycobacteroides abscessus TaxID=36809 RepID=UPI001F271A2F|nr:DUF6036 family nucleotidyltransferase [Mycobacteroides abscessus]